jgi:type I restriction enzyme S subunit
VPSTYITSDAFNNCSAKWIPEGALVIALAGQGKTKGMVAQLAFKSTCNQSMAAIISGSKYTGRYLFWWLDSNYQNIRNLAGGDLRDGLNLELLGNIKCPLPSPAEQTAIAMFLDRETELIDELVAEQQRLIALLKEKRRAVISHAVTKGLNPAAPMKPSGVKWLGELPDHWERTKLKYVTELVVDCPHETPEYSEDGTHLVVRTADVHEGRIYASRMFRVSKAEYVNRVRRAPLLRDDIVYGREGERWGHAALIAESDRFCLGQRMMQFRSDDSFHPEYLMWSLTGASTYVQGDLDTVGATSPHVNVATIRNYHLPHPPLAEQREIGEYLRRHTAQFDSLIDEAQRVIDLLQERREALISASVTGQIDVRGLIESKAA